MDKNKRRRLKINKSLPQLDVEEFNALTDLLFVAAKENHAYCARLLGVSTTTWKKWNTVPPTWPWWNLVLRHAIKYVISNMVATRRMTTAKHQRNITQALARIKHSDQFEEDIAATVYDLRGAELHLRTILTKQGMFANEIYLAANCGGYTERTLRTAARNLGIVRTQEGFGKNKRSFWRLPTEEDE